MIPGEIVLTRFPHADLQEGKLRPALVVAVAPGKHADLLIAMITSRTYQTVPDFDEVIEATDLDYETTGLKITSCVRLARLVTVAPSTINARLGNVSPDRLHRIRDRLASWLENPTEPE